MGPSTFAALTVSGSGIAIDVVALPIGGGISAEEGVLLKLCVEEFAGQNLGAPASETIIEPCQPAALLSSNCNFLKAVHLKPPFLSLFCGEEPVFDLLADLLQSFLFPLFPALGGSFGDRISDFHFHPPCLLLIFSVYISSMGVKTKNAKDTKKKGRPAGVSQDRPFNMRVNDEFISLVDSWRKSQSIMPTRTEAIRRMVEIAAKKR